MTRVADVSPGTVLRAEFTGDEYTVVSVGDEQMKVRGKHGPLVVPCAKVQDDIANGRLSVMN